MTPDELLAACREAWPDGENSWAADWPEDAEEAAGAEREVGPWRVEVRVEGDVRTDYGDTAVTVIGHPRVDLWDIAGGRVLHSVDLPTPATPSGVREVVGKLRAWCREEARRLAEEVDPVGQDQAPDITELAEARAAPALFYGTPAQGWNAAEPGVMGKIVGQHEATVRADGAWDIRQHLPDRRYTFAAHGQCAGPLAAAAKADEWLARLEPPRADGEGG